MATALREFQGRSMETQLLITLRTDAEIPFAELDNERGTVISTDGGKRYVHARNDRRRGQRQRQRRSGRTCHASADRRGARAARGGNFRAGGNGNAARPGGGLQPAPAVVEAPKPATQAMAIRQAEYVPPANVEYEKQLEPRSIQQAITLANHMFTSRLFPGYGTPQAVLSTIMAGRELGLQTVASLRAFHIVEGKHQMHADLIRVLCSVSASSITSAAPNEQTSARRSQRSAKAIPRSFSPTRSRKLARPASSKTVAAG